MKSVKSVFTKTACMLALVSVSNSFSITQAQVQPQYVVMNKTMSNIRFVRMEGDMLVFEVYLSNLPLGGSVLRIKDGENNTLFEEKINTGTHNIRYKIVRGDINRINFEVSGKKILLNQSFDVRSRVEEKIEVTRAK